MRPLVFIGPSREGLRAFPDTVRQEVGHALNFVQMGRTPESAAPLHGLGSGVQEIRADGDDGTYRAVYTVALPSAVYVVHAFQKKSPRGRAMPRRDEALIRSRLAWARRVDAELQTQGDEHG
jgi:phage-related protein